MISKKFIITCAVIGLIIGIILIPINQRPRIIEYSYTPINGSIVSSPKEGLSAIDYIASFENGTMFDTSMQDVAEANSILKTRNYTRLIISAEDSNIPLEIREAVSNMSVNESRIVKVSSILRDSTLIEAVLKVQTSLRVQTTRTVEFIEILGEYPTEGMVAKPAQLGWNITVLKVGTADVTIRHDPDDGQTLETVFGTARVSKTKDEVIITLPEVELGSVVKTDTGIARIINVSGESLILDFNEQYAGQTLVYNITVRASGLSSADINSNIEGVTLKYFWSEYCAYCKKEEPILQEVLKEHPTLNFIRIDVDNSSTQVEMGRYRVTGTPTHALIDSKSTKIVVGFMNKKQLTSFICSKLDDEACNKSND